MELIQELKRHGIRPRLFSNRDRLKQALLDESRVKQLKCIVAAGGDGTVGDVINRYPDFPVAVLPLGTENLISKYLKIPCSGKFVAEMIANGQTRTIDLCKLGNQRFSIMASFGFDADVVHRTHARRTGHIRKLSYVQPIWQSLRKYTYPELKLYFDDEETPVTGRLAILVNIPAYAMRLPIVPGAEPDDGLFDVRVFERGSGFQMLRYFYKVIRGKHERLSDVRSLRAKRIRVESSEPVPIQMDGDPAGFTPVEIEIVPAGLTIFVPKSD